VGVTALQANTTSTNNTALGYQAAYTQTTAGGDGGNTAIGSKALYINNNYRNTAVGYVAAQYTTGASNVAMGWGALTGVSGSSSGSNTVAIGYQALTNNTSASNNTAVGYQAGYSVVSGSGNTFIGHQSGYLATPTGTSLNVAVGYQSGYNLTGNANTLLGNGSGSQIGSGANNTITGSYNGNQNSLDIRTSSNNSVISNGAGTINFYSDGATNSALFNGAYALYNCYGSNIQSFPGATTMGAQFAWTTMWTVPVGTTGLLMFTSGNFGSYGGATLFLIAHGSGSNTQMVQIAGPTSESQGYTFAFRISGQDFQVQNQTNSVAFVTRLCFIQMS